MWSAIHCSDAGKTNRIWLEENVILMVYHLLFGLGQSKINNNQRQTQAYSFLFYICDVVIVRYT